MSAALDGVAAVVGIGVDAVDVGRMAAVLDRSPGFTARVFSDAERAYADRRADPSERYAARFAAKEAALKAMGVGLWSCPLRDIEVVRAESGAPALALHGAAAQLAHDRGIVRWVLTLTHTDVLALAVAVAFRAVGAAEPPVVSGRGTLSP